MARPKSISQGQWVQWVHTVQDCLLHIWLPAHRQCPHCMCSVPSGHSTWGGNAGRPRTSRCASFSEYEPILTLQCGTCSHMQLASSSGQAAAGSSCPGHATQHAAAQAAAQAASCSSGQARPAYPRQFGMHVKQASNATAGARACLSHSSPPERSSCVIPRSVQPPPGLCANNTELASLCCAFGSLVPQPPPWAVPQQHPFGSLVPQLAAGAELHDQVHTGVVLKHLVQVAHVERPADR